MSKIKCKHPLLFDFLRRYNNNHIRVGPGQNFECVLKFFPLKKSQKIHATARRGGSAISWLRKILGHLNNLTSLYKVPIFGGFFSWKNLWKISNPKANVWSKPCSSVIEILVKKSKFWSSKFKYMKIFVTNRNVIFIGKYRNWPKIEILFENHKYWNAILVKYHNFKNKIQILVQNQNLKENFLEKWKFWFKIRI